MRLSIALLTLTTFAAGQRSSAGFSNPSQTLNLIPSQVPTSIGDVGPSATQSVSGPIQTGQACASIAKIATSSDLQFPSVQAELAYACLKSVPIYPGNASSTIDSLQQLIQFQSTLSYLKDPPQGWPNPPVDLVAGLNDIKSKVNSGSYTNEFDFETDIASLLIKAHDGHLSFDGMAFSGTLKWRRNSNIALISVSKDGSTQPQVYALADLNKTNPSYDPSPVSQINGKDVVQFLQGEANLTSYHDLDTTYNAMFYLQPAQNYGYFVNPRFYPGPTTTLTYANGTSNQYPNTAYVLQASAWKGINDPSSFYETFIVPDTGSSNRLKKRDPNSLPRHLDNPRDEDVQDSFSHDQGYVPAFYPKPFVAHSAADVALAGFFVSTDVGQVGVLVIQTFNTNATSDAVQFQSVVQQYISQAKAQGVSKHIIDVRTNGGGKVLLGYDTYLQFFPSQKPQTQSRWRGSPASTLFGKSISSYTKITSQNAELYTSPFSNEAFVSKDLQKFADWNAMYPPQTFHGDNFTALLKYNLSDPFLTTNAQLGLGIAITGYSDRNNFTQDPFRAEDLILLSDGICASTCSIFVELMVQQSGVKTLAVGGRPQFGPMVAVGGTKGTLVLPYDFLQSVAGYVVKNFATTRSQALDWTNFIPNLFTINVQDSSINFQDNIRAGMESGGVPTQFINDTSSCRIWYEPNMLFNVTSLWAKTAKVAFGGTNGTLDQSSCVKGSATSRGQQTGQGQGNSSSAGSGGNKKNVAAPRRSGLQAVLLCSFMVGMISVAL